MLHQLNDCFAISRREKSSESKMIKSLVFIYFVFLMLLYGACEGWILGAQIEK